MASNTNFIDDYLDPSRESLRQTTQTYYDQAAKNNQDATEDYIASNDEIYDAAATYFRNAAYKQQQQLPQDYQYAYDTNAIQQRINERQVADRQAQLGLTDSGLNRTQQAAINLQRSNADQAVTQQRNAQYNAIQSALMEYLAENSQQKAASAAQARYDLANRNQDLYNTYMTNADSMAASIASNLYSADQQRAAAEAQAVADAQAAQYDAILKQYELGLKYGNNGINAEDISDLAMKMAQSDSDNGNIPSGQSVYDVYRTYLSSLNNTSYPYIVSEAKSIYDNSGKYFTLPEGSGATYQFGSEDLELQKQEAVLAYLKGQIDANVITDDEALQIANSLGIDWGE